MLSALRKLRDAVACAVTDALAGTCPDPLCLVVADYALPHHQAGYCPLAPPIVGVCVVAGSRIRGTVIPPGFEPVDGDPETDDSPETDQVQIVCVQRAADPDAPSQLCVSTAAFLHEDDGPAPSWDLVVGDFHDRDDAGFKHPLTLAVLRGGPAVTDLRWVVSPRICVSARGFLPVAFEVRAASGVGGPLHLALKRGRAIYDMRCCVALDKRDLMSTMQPTHRACAFSFGSEPGGHGLRTFLTYSDVDASTAAPAPRSIGGPTSPDFAFSPSGEFSVGALPRTTPSPAHTRALPAADTKHADTKHACASEVPRRTWRCRHRLRASGPVTSLRALPAGVAPLPHERLEAYSIGDRPYALAVGRGRGSPIVYVTVLPTSEFAVADAAIDLVDLDPCDPETKRAVASAIDDLGPGEPSADRELVASVLGAWDRNAEIRGANQTVLALDGACAVQECYQTRGAWCRHGHEPVPLVGVVVSRPDGTWRLMGTLGRTQASAGPGPACAPLVAAPCRATTSVSASASASASATGAPMVRPPGHVVAASSAPLPSEDASAVLYVDLAIDATFTHFSGTRSGSHTTVTWKSLHDGVVSDRGDRHPSCGGCVFRTDDGYLCLVLSPRRAGTWLRSVALRARGYSVGSEALLVHAPPVAQLLSFDPVHAVGEVFLVDRNLYGETAGLVHAQVQRGVRAASLQGCYTAGGQVHSWFAWRPGSILLGYARNHAALWRDGARVL